MPLIQKIAPCLWFDHQAEEAARFYTQIFLNSRISRIARYSDAGREIHGRPPGSVMTVEFEIAGQTFTALNGGPVFQLSPAISFVVRCESQQELDSYWEKLSEGGDPAAQQCGWLQDKYGVSWQIVPAALAEMLGDENTSAAARTMQALLGMKKLDLQELQQAHAGN